MSCGGLKRPATLRRATQIVLPAARMVILPGLRGRNVSRATPAAVVLAAFRTPAPRAFTRTPAIGAPF